MLGTLILFVLSRSACAIHKMRLRCCFISGKRVRSWQADWKTPEFRKTCEQSRRTIQGFRTLDCGKSASNISMKLPEGSGGDYITTELGWEGAFISICSEREGSFCIKRKFENSLWQNTKSWDLSLLKPCSVLGKIMLIVFSRGCSLSCAKQDDVNKRNRKRKRRNSRERKKKKKDKGN